MNKRYSLDKFHFVLFLELFMTSGFSFVNDLIPRSFVIGIWIVMLFLLLSTKAKLSVKPAIVVLFLSINIFLSSIVNHERILLAFFYIFPYIVVLFIQSTLSYEDFRSRFIDVMYFLCIVSLLCFAAFILFPSLNSKFSVIGKMGDKYSNLYIFSYRNNFRNQGMFWEPGAFQTFINLAIMFELSSKNIRKSRLIVFLITILTTFSTTGYACTLYLVLVYALDFKVHKKNKNRIRYMFLFFGVLLFVFMSFWGDLLLSVSSNSTFGKLISFFGNKEYLLESGNRLSSASIRYFSIVKPIAVFFENPILGCGYNGLSEKIWNYTFGMNTCTFINYFAVYGLAYGVIMLVGYFKNVKILNGSNNPFRNFLLFVFMFLITSTEDYVNNSFFLLLVLYGYSCSENSLSTNDETI